MTQQEQDLIRFHRQEAQRALLNAGIIIAIGLALVYLVLGAVGFWEPVP